MGYDTPKPRDLDSLRNWVSGTGAIARKETAYLTRPGALADLMSIAGVVDAGVETIEPHIVNAFIAVRNITGRVWTPRPSPVLESTSSYTL